MGWGSVWCRSASGSESGAAGGWVGVTEGFVRRGIMGEGGMGLLAYVSFVLGRRRRGLWFWAR
jgi:hypothetical protein